MKAFGYLRVSGLGQIDGDGFERQREAISSFAQKRGYTVVDFFEERGISGTKGEEDRPAFKEMLSAILANGVRTIIVESLDRLAREYRIQEQILLYLASHDVKLINASTEEDVTEAVQADPMRKAMVQVQGVFSELDKSLLVRKLKKARERVREANGKCEGRKPYSVANPEVVREIKRLRRKPKGNAKRKTYAQVAEELNRKGLRTQSGGTFTAQNVQMILRRNG